MMSHDISATLSEAAAPVRKKRGLRIALLSVGGVIVLGIAASIVVPMVQQAFLPKPAETVEQFLTAVAESDAETALSFVDIDSGDNTDLLTDEVLEVSNAAHPLTDIQVGEPTNDDSFWRIPVTYRFGDIEREQTFTVAEATPGEPKGTVVSGASDIFVPLAAVLAPTINGVAVEPGVPYAVFPGVYDFAIDHPNLTVGMPSPTPATPPGAFDPAAVVVDSVETAQGLSSVTSVPTPEAQAAVHELIAASLTQCATSKARDTDCGLYANSALAGAQVPIDGTVVRTFAPEDQALLDQSTLSLVDDSDPFRYNVSGQITMSATCSVMLVDLVRTDDYDCGPVYADDAIVDFSSAEIQLEWHDD